MTEDIIAKITEALRTNPELKHRAEIAYRFLLDPQARVVSQGALDLALNQPWQDESHEDSFKANIKSWMPGDPEEVIQARLDKQREWRFRERWDRIIIHRKPNNYVRVLVNTDRNIAYLVPRIRKANGGFGYKAVGVPQSTAGLFEASIDPVEILLVHQELIDSIGTLPVPNWPGSLQLSQPADVLLGQWVSSEQVWDRRRYLEHVRTHARDDRPWNL